MAGGGKDGLGSLFGQGPGRRGIEDEEGAMAAERRKGSRRSSRGRREGRPFLVACVWEERRSRLVQRPGAEES